MIQVKMTKNFAGFEIIGSYEDFNELYDNIMLAIGPECEHENIEDARLHVLAFLYDLRHAYKGHRNIIVADTSLDKETKKVRKIKEKVDYEVLYGFYYLVPDALMDILIIKYFLSINREGIIDEFDQCRNTIRLFQSKLVNALNAMLTKEQMIKVEQELYDSMLLIEDFILQWIDLLNKEYIYATKIKRKNMFMDILDKVCNYFNYPEFASFKLEIESLAREHNIPVNEVTGPFNDYDIDGIKW